MDELDLLRAAVELSRLCPPSNTAFSVGAIVVDRDGNRLAEGYSRQDGDHDHAEEAALRGLAADDPRLAEATIYSSLEPCSMRKSRPRTCSELIVAAGIRRVVFALREPSIFVPGGGARVLREHGVTVVERPELAEDVRQINAHLLRT
jgi:diaminohydroxyphosphoribosylaminopyrimidine deaminase/5-amino-6-(5-phosphoribosylamino)uracil reductase